MNVKTITRKGRRYIETPCKEPDLDKPCRGCDLYDTKKAVGSKCGKGPKGPRCIGPLRPDNKWIVFKEVRK